MAVAIYLEHFLDGLEELPEKLRLNFHQMREMDEQTQQAMLEADRLGSQYLQSVKSLSGSEREDQLDAIHQLFQRARALGDDKVQLAYDTYELVDREIRELDKELIKFEAELREKQLLVQPGGQTAAAAAVGDDKKRRKDDSVRGRKRKISGEPTQASPAVGAGGGAPVAIPGAPPLSLLTGTGAELMDMPVDPNEPTYCICHQVSFGEMIGCDNIDCPIEWFHFACVGLTAKPKGKWFCERCSADRKRKA